MDRTSFYKGQSFLALVFFIGGILSISAILIALLALSNVDTGYGIAASFRAEAVATAGAEDGLLQIDRQGSYFSAAAPGYTVALGSSTAATVTVTQNSPGSGFATILSAATVSGHTRKISVVVSENPSTGQTNVVSWADVQ